ncbi:hypothetical protein GGG17_11875 [Arsenicicoccus sp. MKL-02]|uniref:Serine aminopeptidase S33 domain-containing protein n=1 Tax=Arsenicicoccus cauae TaxID=2663847 RepID=A0A6I3IJ20_9MICO|nr:hypothetical protein [Arsenicicoccus cauae]MTB72653.1 hypothetical protein [Arsenicicoccus cauae]
MGEPTWIGEGERTLSAWICRPVGECVGVVVVAPSFGREAVISARALHVLGVRLAEAGFVSVRFDWRGSGSSAALPGSDPVTAWHQDLTTVEEFVQSWSQGLPIHFIGLRLGATVLSTWTSASDALRLCWEPVNGRAYVRASVKLRQLSCEVPSVPVSTGVELCGVMFSGEAIERLSSLKLKLQPGSGTTQVRKESDRRVADLLYSAHPRFAAVPHAAISDIIGQLPRAETQPVPRPTARLCATFNVGGVEIVERFVQVGPHALHGVLTEPTSGSVASVVFTAAGAESAEGPSGLWVTIAREQGAHGVMGIRAERRGLGVHLDPDQPREPNPYCEEAVEDVEAAVAFITERAGVLPTAIGLCVGAWLFLRASSRVQLRRIVALDNLMWQPDPRLAVRYMEGPWLKRFFGTVDEVPGDEPAPRRRRDRAKGALKRVRDVAKGNVPLPLRTLLARQALMEDADSVFRGVPIDLPVELHFGDIGERHFLEVEGKAAGRRWERQGRPVLRHYWHDMDHSALGETSRQRIRTIAETALRRRP